MLFTVLKCSHSEQVDKGRGVLAGLLVNCCRVPGTGLSCEANRSFPVRETVGQHMLRFLNVSSFLPCNSFKNLS